MKVYQLNSFCFLPIPEKIATGSEAESFLKVREYCRCPEGGHMLD